MKYNCPVCNAAGLPDYKVIPTTCHQCNSDLKPYLCLHSISKIKGTKLTRLALVTAGILFLILIFLFFNSISERRKRNSENSLLISQLQDSVSLLQSHFKLQYAEQTKSNPGQTEVVIEYKVRLNDCPSKIAQFFYNDWTMYKKIETDNHLVQPYTLKVGQILKISIGQK